MNPAKGIVIPFPLAESPRLVLQWLSVQATVPQMVRDKIGEWLDGYNLEYAAHIEKTYGHAMVHFANDFSIMMGTALAAEIDGARKQIESDIFDRLEGDMFGGAGAQ